MSPTVTIKRPASPLLFLTTAVLLLVCLVGFVRVADADSQTFNFTGAVQTFMVPAGVTQVTIDASGAQGGAGSGPGGSGARLVASFTVTPGETLNVVVGGVGSTNSSFGVGAGGGASFVYRTADAAGLLISAAGGGGGSQGSAGIAGSATTTASNGEGPGGSAGTGGNGGGGGGSSFACTGGGGGGLLTNGGDGNGGFQGGRSLANGAAGGSANPSAPAGGFGGGGQGAPVFCGTFGGQGGGGGGGYNGGGGGAASQGTAASGGGGGSFSATAPSISQSGVKTGNGQVVMTYAASPTIAKAFGAGSIPVGGTTTLTFTLTNPNSGTALTGVGFTDTLPAGLTVANGTSAVCGGTLTTSGNNTITLAGATISASGSCVFPVTVTGTSAGVKNNTTNPVTSNEGGTGLTASASVTVVAPPTIGKAFGASSIPVNGTTSLTFTLTNPNSGTALTGVGFSDTLPAGLTVANTTSAVCGGTLTTSGGNTITLAGATIAASGNCVFPVTVTGTAAGTKNNTTGPVTSTNGGTGGPASASVDVVAPPAISKAFGATSLGLNGTTSLSFTTTNPAGNAVALTGVAFTDTLPAGLVVATPNGLTGSCGGGTITANAGSNSISLSGATIAAGGSCTFSVNVTAVASGTQVNTTSNVTSTNGGTGNAATASINVLAPDLAITKTHTGTFVKGQTADYTITVSNVGAGPTSGTVTVTDTLPGGLTATAMSGTGWTCTLGTLTCTRSDALAAGASYPPITLTVSIAATAPNSLSNSAAVTGGGDASPANNTATDPTSLGAAPIPTLSTYAQAVFVLIVVLSGLLLLRRRHAASR